MSSFESNTESDKNSSSISLSEVSESFSFEKPSEKEKTQKFCRCIFCFNVPLIYFKSKYIYLKCINCPDVCSKRLFYNYMFRDLTTYQYLLKKDNYDNLYFDNGQFYEQENGKKKLPISCIDNYCEKHFLKFYYFCETCQTNLCIDCKNNHNGHIIKYLNDYKLSSKEIEEIEKIIFETSEYFQNNIDIIKRTKKSLEDNLINVLNELDEHKNDLNKELINDLMNKIPNNINDIKNFPNDFNNYMSNLINILDDINLTKVHYENNLIGELQDKIIEKFELFEKEISNLERDIDDYIIDNKYFIMFAQNILDFYKLKENKINYQIIINLVNLRDNLQNLSNNKIIINEFEEFQYFMNHFLNGKSLLKNYKGIENVFSEELLKANVSNIQNLDKYKSSTNIEQISLLTNISIRELKIMNWIKNLQIFSEIIVIYQW